MHKGDRLDQIRSQRERGASQSIAEIPFTVACRLAGAFHVHSAASNALQALSEDTQPGRASTISSTRWSVIEAARSEPEQRQRALDVLISAYWKPVYKYIRSALGKDQEEAKDLTQDFFVRLIEKHLLDRFDAVGRGCALTCGCASTAWS